MPAQHPVHVVVTGVSGSGKSTVGAALAVRLGVPYAEGDEFHSAKNVATMAAGTPLTDDDRWPWLADLVAWMSTQHPAHSGIASVVACSALRRAYREALAPQHGTTWFVQLDVPQEVLEERMRLRAGHFMPASLLRSQLETHEKLGVDEGGLQVRADHELNVVLDTIVGALATHLRGMTSTCASIHILPATGRQ